MTTVIQRIYRDVNGKATLDPKKAISLLIAEGSVISDEEAKGLPSEALRHIDDAKQVKQAPNDKAMKNAPNK